MLLLVPVSALVAVIARPLVSVLLGGTPGCPRAAMVALGARMLMVFAPQILLYGLAVVLYGILQSHRRFAAPALAPVLSSLVVIGAYFWFGAVGNGYQNMVRPVPTLAWVVLAAGTTVGVAALVATPLIPSVRLRLRLRPTLRFPAGVGARVRSLAAAGISTLIAQDASVAVVIVLANSRGGSGALVLYSFAWAVFFLPYAVLAVPIATSAFPELAARDDRFDATSATSTRAVIVASWLGVAGMAGTCIPLARVFQSHVGQAADARQLAIALAAFAPGLVGYGLTANLSRVLYADARNRAAAVAVSGGWLLVIVADLLIVPFVSRSAVVPWLGAGTTIGLTVSGIALLVLVRRVRGPAALRGCGRAALAGLAGALAGAAAGLGVAAGIPVSGFPAERGRHAARQRRRAGGLLRGGGRGRTAGTCARWSAAWSGREGRLRAGHQHGRYRPARAHARGRLRGAGHRGRGVRAGADRPRLRLQRGRRRRVHRGRHRGPPAPAPRPGGDPAAAPPASRPGGPTWCTRTACGPARWPRSRWPSSGPVCTTPGPR